MRVACRTYLERNVEAKDVGTSERLRRLCLAALEAGAFCHREGFAHGRKHSLTCTYPMQDGPGGPHQNGGQRPFRAPAHDSNHAL